MDQTTSWQPDPYGVHEFRFFSADGKPTLLVMDAGKTSYDRPPATAPLLAPEPTSSPDLEPSSSAAPEPAPAPGLPSTLPSDPPLAPEPRPTAPLALAPPAITVGADRVATPFTGYTSEAGTENAAAAADLTRVTAPAVTELADDRLALGVEDGSPEPLSRSLKIAYGIVLTALALSALGLMYVHFRPTAGGHPTLAASPTTTSSTPRGTTTTLALPTALKPSAEAAAAALVSSWSTANRTAALTLATPAAITALFAVPYASGLALDRGCSTSFSPIVCTFGPPGGASPTDPIYEIMVSQVQGGWYVSSVKIEN